MTEPSAKPCRIELWGGVECTVNRVGEECFEQLHRSGHHARPRDLDLFAELGITALRYPVLWERTAPDSLEGADWSWPDERLTRLRELGVRSIVGLLHHGSGPRHTSLIDPAFPEKFAAYAKAVAGRYPWVDAYTPVNEPLTTARFCGLYGIWHPHGRNAQTFARTLLAQCRATVLAMRAIREINPRAQLIQNEDIGKAHATRPLEYQAEFENERRWLTFDLLCGRVNPDHRFWDYFLDSGIAREDLEWFLEYACPPDIIGFDSYIRSERFFDHRVARYSGERPGSNGRHTYIDVAAVHVREDGPDGPASLLRETWQRYGIPIAITEAHSDGAREEQMRWLLEMWRAAEAVQAEGADIRALTAWGLLGLFDWNSLMTRNVGWYESGAYDVRGREPRPTAVAGLIRDLARGREPDHPVLEVPGWWQRNGRFTFGFSVSETGRMRTIAPSRSSINHLISSRIQPLMIVGRSTALAETVVRQCEQRGIPYCRLAHAELNLANVESLRNALDLWQPWAVVDVGSYDSVDPADINRTYDDRVDVRAAVVLARACKRRQLRLVRFSSDQVYPSGGPDPLLESSIPQPVTVFGESQLEADIRTLQILPSALIARTGPLFSPCGAQDFLMRALQQLAGGVQTPVATSPLVSPTYAPDAIHAALDLLLDNECGVWHLANLGAVSVDELVQLAARAAGLSEKVLGGLLLRTDGRLSPAPSSRALESERGALLPELYDAVQRYIGASAPLRIIPPTDVTRQELADPV